VSDKQNLRNVFDDKAEFEKLNDLVLSAIKEFSDYRQGNLTYGEIMYVMECILDSLRNTSEKEAQKTNFSKSFGQAPSFSLLLAVNSRLIETLLKKGIISTEDELYALYGERD
jgi:hypothetical protein